MRRALGASLAIAILILPACGGNGDEEVTIAAAASLTEAFNGYAEGFEPARVRLSFAGSNQLAAQIRQGVRPDVFASADAELPRALFAEGLVERPVGFAVNSLVLAVPADSTIDSLDELERPGTAIAIGAPDVPVGAYAREALGRLPDGGAEILANVRSEEPDVKGVVGKLTQGAADAGLVYASDVAASGGRLRAIPLSPRLQPEIEYSAAVVAGAENPGAASAFIAGLLGGEGAGALREAGLDRPRGR